MVPPPGSDIVVRVPHRCSEISPTCTPLFFKAATRASMSSHMKYISCLLFSSCGWNATSAAGTARINHPSPASAEREPNVFLKNMRPSAASSNRRVYAKEQTYLNLISQNLPWVQQTQGNEAAILNLVLERAVRIPQITNRHGVIADRRNGLARMRRITPTNAWQPKTAAPPTLLTNDDNHQPGGIFALPPSLLKSREEF